jgi:hypothetical protein
MANETELTPEQTKLVKDTIADNDATQKSAHEASQGKIKYVRPSGKTKKVIAYAAGYYGHYREIGDIFEVAIEEESPSTWFRDAKTGANGAILSADEELV